MIYDLSYDSFDTFLNGWVCWEIANNVHLSQAELHFNLRQAELGKDLLCKERTANQPFLNKDKYLTYISSWRNLDKSFGIYTTLFKVTQGKQPNKLVK